MDGHLAKSVPEKTGSFQSAQLCTVIHQEYIGTAVKEGGTHISEVDHRIPSFPTEDVQECKRDSINRIVCAIKGQRLLCPSPVLSPITLRKLVGTLKEMKMVHTQRAIHKNGSIE